MSSLTDKYTKNYSASEKRAFEKLVRDEMTGSITELSAILLVKEKMRSGNKKGGLIGKPLGAGGKK